MFSQNGEFIKKLDCFIKKIGFQHFSICRATFENLGHFKIHRKLKKKFKIVLEFKFFSKFKL